MCRKKHQMKMTHNIQIEEVEGEREVEGPPLES
jgi:hypothetical protein